MALTKAHLPEHKDMVKNVLYAWATATPDDFEEGMCWYGKAYYQCETIAQACGFQTEQIVALMAILSPGMVWDENESAPERVVDLYLRGIPATDWTGFSTYPHNLLKCERILQGDFTALGGRKVRSFYNNILGHNDCVTIDRWAIRVALDDHKIGKDLIVPSGEAVYQMLSNAYFEAAHLLGQDVTDVQAVTWCRFRNKYSGKVLAAKRAKARSLNAV